MKRMGMVVATLGVAVLYLEHGDSRNVVRTFVVARAQATSSAAMTSPPDFDRVVVFLGGVLLTLFVLEMSARALAARKERKAMREATLRLLNELPLKFMRAGIALDHPDVTHSTKSLLESAAKEFDAMHEEALRMPEDPHPLCILKHVDSAIAVALENAAHEKECAAQARAGDACRAEGE